MWIKAHDTIPNRIDQWRERHGRAGMAGFGGLDGIHRERTDRIDRQLRHSLFKETEAEHRCAFDRALGVLRCKLEFADRFVDQAHLFVSDAEIVVSVVVLAVELLLHALLEFFEDLLERLLFLAEGDLIARFLHQLRFKLRGEVEEVLLFGEEILLLRFRHRRCGGRGRGGGRRWGRGGHRQVIVGNCRQQFAFDFDPRKRRKSRRRSFGRWRRWRGFLRSDTLRRRGDRLCCGNGGIEFLSPFREIGMQRKTKRKRIELLRRFP